MIQWVGRLLRERSRMLSVLLFFAGIYVVSQLSIAAALDPILPADVLRLQTTFDAADFAAQVALMYERGLVEHYLAHYYYDFAHPVWYATLLALLLARGFVRAGVPARHDAWLLLPYVAGLCDIAENGLHLYMVVDTANITQPLVTLSAVAASVKWGIVALAILAVAALWLRPAAPQSGSA